MLKEFKTYTLICDICGYDLYEDTEYSGFSELDYVYDDAVDNCSWHLDNENDKHYCSSCYEIDDEIIIKEKSE